jgi:hypothetical protein
VQRLLSIADVVERLRPLVAERARPRRRDLHARLSAEMAELFRLLGLDHDR